MSHSNEPLHRERERRQDRRLALALFGLALLPRALDLGAFLTIDEPNWTMRSARFALGLLNGDLGATFQTNHPGVITMWTGSLGLAVYYITHSGVAASLGAFLQRVAEGYLVADMLPFVHLPTGVLAAGSAAAIYLLARRPLGRPIALFGAALVALDPFFVAHSRVLHHDALGAMFLSVSVLALINYLTADRRSRVLVLSGAAAGLASLSKASSLFLGPLAVLFVLCGLASRDGCKSLPRSGFRTLLVWLASFGATFFVAWPATWVHPLDTVRRLIAGTGSLVEAGHHQYFHGQVTTDAGPWFYPAIALLRSTPVSLVGAILAVLVLAALYRRASLTEPARARRLALALCTLCIVAFAAFITLSPKKQDRYLLPIFPLLDVLAAAGWLGAFELLPSGTRRRASVLVIGGLVAWTMALAAIYHPYYLSFYNPLAGGAERAQQELLIGWGEGLDQVGRYLDAKPDAEGLTVAAAPYGMLKPYFRGVTTDYLTSNAPALAADYVVEYVDNVQRRGPDLALWQYLRDLRPEAVFRLHGLDYAWLYPGPRFLTRETPRLDSYSGGKFGDQLECLGFRAEPSPGAVTLELFWRALRPPAHDYAVSVRLEDAAGHRWAQADGRPVRGLLPTSDLTPGWVARDDRILGLPAGAPGGDYRVAIYVYGGESGENLPLAAGGFGLNAGAVSVPARRADPAELKPARRLDAEIAPGLTLLGVDPAVEVVQPGGSLSPRLHWSVQSATSSQPAQLVLSPAGGDGPEVKQDIGFPGTGAWLDWTDLHVPAGAANGPYVLSVRVGDRLTKLGDVRVEGRARRFDVPAIAHPATADFDGKIAWLGWQTAGDSAGPGGRVRLILVWRALAVMDRSYKVFAHVIGPDDSLLGQRDLWPGEGSAPTTGWAPGEVLSDTVEIEIPPTAPAGPYRVRLGWYDEETGARLPAGQTDSLTFELP